MRNVYVALENIRSLHNVGVIIRTCSFFGFYKLILIGYSGNELNFKGKKVLHPQLEKTALGAEKDIEVIFLEDTEKLSNFAEGKNLKVISVEQHGNSVKLKDWKPENSAILVFGNEVKGVSKDTLKISAEIVEIEGFGKKDSLNVTTAVGIMLSKVDQGMSR
jgi:tRNA G18 (ribose-2'-O)-methylase SpoU